MLVAADDVAGLRGDGTFQVAIIVRVFLDDRDLLSAPPNRLIADGLEESLHIRFRQLVFLLNPGIADNLRELLQDRGEIASSNSPLSHRSRIWAGIPWRVMMA